MIKVNQTGRFNRLLDELRFGNPELEVEINKRIRWFKKNPRDTRLAHHSLTKRMAGKWAFSITGDIRIVYEWLNKTTVRFLAIGRHQKVYQRRSK